MQGYLADKKTEQVSVQGYLADKKPEQVSKATGRPFYVNPASGDVSFDPPEPEVQGDLAHENSPGTRGTGAPRS